MTSEEIKLHYDPRVAALHLGERKYTTPSRAIGELVANAFDARATQVHVSIVQNELGANELLRVTDNGLGMLLETIRARFTHVGVLPDEEPSDATRFARFGVGRFAVHRLGSTATWTTVATNERGRKVRTVLRLESAKPDLLQILSSEQVKAATPLGTSIEIVDLKEGDSVGFLPSRIATDLTQQFCAFLLSHPHRLLNVQGNGLDVRALIDRESDERIPGNESIPESTLKHIVLRNPVDRTRFPAQVIYTAKGQTVASEQPESALAPQYVGIVDCGYLEELITANREDLVSFDPLFVSLQTTVRERVVRYQSEMKASHHKHFLHEARSRSYYPFRNEPQGLIQQTRRVVFDAVLAEVNDRANLEGMTQRQQGIIFRLLARVVENEDLLDVLGELVELSDEQVQRFREVLEKTTLDSILRLASEVTNRLDFLNTLHELIYGETGRHLLERAHLHQLLEPHAWLFGEAFHLATSDQSFRNVIARHRELADLPPVEKSVLREVRGVDLIPDLFFATRKEYAATPQNRHLLVEIKAPKVKVGKKELDQILRYADVILDSAEFDKESVSWDLFCVSADVSPEVDKRRKSPDRKFGMVENFEGMRVWIFRWSEIIARAREEHHLVRKHLEEKSRDLRISDYLLREFPEVLEGLEERMGDVLNISH